MEARAKHHDLAVHRLAVVLYHGDHEPQLRVGGMEHQHHALRAHSPDMRICRSGRHTYQERHRTAIARMVLGGARTHIIWSGIRYFSCFSDAANYGVHSAMAAVTFSISAFFVDSRWKRLYFLFIALCGIYGMGISGTRSAMGVLMGGMLMITIIAKNWKALLGGIFISIGIFVFFYYTNIGSGNQ